MMKTTGLALDLQLLEHNLGSTHPESPGRLEAIHKRLTETGLLSELTPIEGAPVREWLTLIHDASHIQSVVDLPSTGNVAKLAVSCAFGAVDAVASSKVENAFCAIRPPGHHAHNNGGSFDGNGEGEGFCFYNTIALAARYAQKKWGLEKILIVDWDYHHGNGTEWAFYDDPSVLFFSTHALYDYPGTGGAHRTGEGEGQGFNINAPLDKGATDINILSAFESRLLKKVEQFKPNMILISAGFDSREEDLLGTFRITDEGFYKLTQMMMDLAQHYCNGKLVSFLEGGYNLQTLPLAVEAHLAGLSGGTHV